MAAYQLLDATANGGGASNLSSGGGQPVSPVFQADTLAHAQALAQQWATAFQRSCQLAVFGSLGPYTVYSPAAAGSALGNQATGISF